MPNISTEQIRDISIKAVEGLLNNKVPLSEGLAKYASALELNSEQVQRAVEATNSIAVLKIQSLSDDRTIEFPLCKYAEVMNHIAVPDMTKVASITVEKTSSVGKTVPIESTNPTLSDTELKIHFIKVAAENESQLNALRDRAETIVPQMLKLASEIKIDKEGLNKLSAVAGEEFPTVSALIYGEAKTANSFYSKNSGLFKEAELKTVNQLVGLVKEAREVRTSIKEKSELHDRSQMTKSALLGTIGKALGYVVSKPIGAVAGLAGRAANRTISNVAGSVGNAARRTVGVAEKPFTPKKLGIGAAVVAGGSIAGDAVMYQPGRDADTGRSKDVWTSLQREN